MKPPPFAYAAPGTRAEALALLARHGYDAKVLAGGQSLVPALNFRLARPPVLVDINGIPGLDAIAERDGELSFGALVRHTDAERSALVARRCPPLAKAIGHIGHRTIRNRGTIGGSIAHADPAAELPLVMVALGGRVNAASVRGERWIAASDFFTGYLATALEPDELLVEARFPALASGATWGFQEYSRRSGDFALAMACVTLTRSGGKVTACSIGVAGGGPVPVRASGAERALIGTEAGTDACLAAASSAASGLEIDGDIHGSAAYRRSLVETVVRRALWTAAGLTS